MKPGGNQSIHITRAGRRWRERTFIQGWLHGEVGRQMGGRWMGQEKECVLLRVHYLHGKGVNLRYLKQRSSFNGRIR